MGTVGLHGPILRGVGQKRNCGCSSALGLGQETSQFPQALTRDTSFARSFGSLAFYTTRTIEMRTHSLLCKGVQSWERPLRGQMGFTRALLCGMAPSSHLGLFPCLLVSPRPRAPHSRCHSRCRRHVLWQETRLSLCGHGTCKDITGRAHGTSLKSPASLEP